MTDEELQVIRARCEAATEGPWEVAWKTDYIWQLDGDGDRYEPIAEADYAEGNHHNNATFIAHAREDIPALLAEVERLREAQRWIPVSERMPKVGSDIWAYSDADGCCWTAYVADDEDYPIVDDLRHLPIQRVTYWMPQTKPPESQP